MLTIQKIDLLNESLRILVELNQKLNCKIVMNVHKTQQELALSNTERLIVAQQHRKTIYICVPWDRVHHIKSVPLSNYFIEFKICTCKSLHVCACIWGSHMIVCSFTHMFKMNGSFLCYLIFSSPAKQHHLDVVVLAYRFVSVFLKRENHSFYLCKNLQVSTCFFQVNQKLTYLLDLCNRSTATTPPIVIYTTFQWLIITIIVITIFELPHYILFQPI